MLLFILEYMDSFCIWSALETPLFDRVCGLNKVQLSPRLCPSWSISFLRLISCSGITLNFSVIGMLFEIVVDLLWTNSTSLMEVLLVQCEPFSLSTIMCKSRSRIDVELVNSPSDDCGISTHLLLLVLFSCVIFSWISFSHPASPSEG